MGEDTVTIHGYVTEDETPADYAPDLGTTDPVKLCREYEIAIRDLLSECERLEGEIAQRDATIQELTIDLLRAEEAADKATTPTHG
jgi:hypothetical protein